ncbi:MAG: ABC transporter substrate-binding protein [Pseudophaeobacter sp. bin_em_oilr2.035]|uniref:ABC transporter substrate-binding protein n=2 Tax=Phaeobacter gallaeciensis TaxID=60890 RepID=A0ABD4XFI3_9RHOB|nr:MULTISPECIES: ABC transporter substrate-binding protein [Phaeobacter]MDF1774291.1 ABC transporter substrate-binding protein [Pseudophaeobacter sp. bin_em_oilr2.035]MEE2818948.1 ABC transporter substrate-binding protein [Pseudomonadota bacterium]MDE4063231.1 ABC transporter substrate-binding protein [Phaeobacter gallaeciensis]MDE4126227.1 ABC transporter substrate-binding protein [Phaeobacter gallaeciensis]MDE4130706.1 ABC transporter substrate-binding protein [Phaeobacter gallaeciensis]
MSLRKTMLAAATFAAFPFIAQADQGVTANNVSFAQVAAFEGPAAALGQGMRLGISAAFEEANAAGGVHGRTLTLDSMDDGYEPDRSAALVKSVVDANDHIGLIGAVGTPTASATQPIATAANVPFIGPFTGAGFLRDASHGNIFNVRATYATETEAWIEYLVDQQGMKSIALLYQDDGFGRVGLAGVTAALEKRGMTLAAEGTYTRNTTAVKKALLTIRKAKPDAVVMVGAYKPVAEFIKLSRKLKLDATFVNISFVGSEALAQELGDEGEGVIISQVVPFPWDSSIPVVAQYTEALKAYDAAAKPGFVSLEGYIVGRLAIKALEDAGKDLTRESFLAALSGLSTVDLGGAKMVFGANDNQGMDDVFLTRITADGGFAPVVPGGGS